MLSACKYTKLLYLEYVAQKMWGKKYLFLEALFPLHR